MEETTQGILCNSRESYVSGRDSRTWNRFNYRHSKRTQTAIIFNPAIIMDNMRNFRLVLISVTMLLVILVTGCTNLVPGVVHYQPGSLEFTIRSEKAVPDGVLEVAIFRLQDFQQAELSRNAEIFPLTAGDNIVTIPVTLQKGKYRCFIYYSSGTIRYPVVIKDFEV